MKYYVRPTVDGENFTAGKLYEIQHGFGSGRVVVLNDAKEEIIVRCDGIVSARLDWRGKFERVSFPSAQEAMESAQRTAAQAIRDLSKDSGWRITKDAGIQIKSDKDSGWRITKDAEMNKRDCIAAEAVIDQLYDIFTEARNPDQLVSLARQAKIFSDAFLELQKIR